MLYHAIVSCTSFQPQEHRHSQLESSGENAPYNFLLLQIIKSRISESSRETRADEWASTTPLSYDFLITESLKLLVLLSRDVAAKFSLCIKTTKSLYIIWKRFEILNNFLQKVHCTSMRMRFGFSQVAREFVGNIIKMMPLMPLTWKGAPEGSFNFRRYVVQILCVFVRSQIVVEVVFFARIFCSNSSQKSQFQQMQHKFFFCSFSFSACAKMLLVLFGKIYGLFRCIAISLFVYSAALEEQKWRRRMAMLEWRKWEMNHRKIIWKLLVHAN